MLRKQVERIASTLAKMGAPLFILSLFVLAEIPILPLGSVLGPYSAALNVFAIVAVAVALFVTLDRRNAVSYYVLGTRLGLDLQEHEIVSEFFNRPLIAWLWLIVDFGLLWLVTTMATGSIIYNLAAVSQLFNPFTGEITLVSVFLFILDQACKGVFFDVMEIFNLAVPSGLSFDPSSHPIFASVLVAFRMAVTISFVQLVVLYASIYTARHDPRLVKLADLTTRR